MAASTRRDRRNERHRRAGARHTRSRDRVIPKAPRLAISRRLVGTRQLQHRGRAPLRQPKGARVQSTRRSPPRSSACAGGANNHNRSLYQNNKAVHEVLRYGVSAKTDPGKPSEVIHLIDWRTGAERLRHRGRGDAHGRLHSPPGHRALRQRHRRRRAGAEEQPGLDRGGHPPVDLEPVAGVQRLVLFDGAIRLRGQRQPGSAIRHDRHS